MKMNDHAAIKQYNVSVPEMTRRKRGYLSMLVSVVIGFYGSFWEFVLGSPGLALAVLIFAGLLIFALRMVLGRSLNNHAHTRIILTRDSLERRAGDHLEIWLLQDISGIRIKKTVRGLIRDIRLKTADGRTMYINGLECFSDFGDELCQALQGRALIEECTEPLDFDHPAFYILFGLLVGVLASTALKAGVSWNATVMAILHIVVTAFLIGIGAYFVIARPLAKTFANRTPKSDWGWGLAFFAVSAMVYFYA